MKKIRKVTLYAAIVAALAACGGGGGSDGGTAGSGGSATSCADSTTFCVYSPSVAEGAALEQKYAAIYVGGSGQNIAPAIEIKNVPAAAMYLSMVMDDETQPECGIGTAACVHAGVFDLPRTKVQLTEGENLSSVSGATFGGVIAFMGANGYVAGGYVGPFPPVGVNHTYKITIYAHKSSWSSDYGVITGTSTRTSAYGRQPASRAEVFAEHGPTGDNDIVDSKTITFTYMGR